MPFDLRRSPVPADVPGAWERLIRWAVTVPDSKTLRDVALVAGANLVPHYVANGRPYAAYTQVKGASAVTEQLTVGEITAAHVTVYATGACVADVRLELSNAV